MTPHKKGGKLVVGGKLREELRGVPQFRRWATQANLSGRLINFDDNHINDKTEEITNNGQLASDDPHIIALAKVSGARLLFSNDTKLKKDFKNPAIINDGKIYTTTKTKSFTKSHRNLLKSHTCKHDN